MYKVIRNLLLLFFITLTFLPAFPSEISRGEVSKEPRLFQKLVLSKDTIYTGDNIRAVLYLYSNYDLNDVSYKKEVKYSKKLAVICQDVIRRVGIDNVDGQYYYVYKLKEYDIKANNDGLYEIKSPEVEATYFTYKVIYDGFMPYKQSQTHQTIVKATTAKLIVKKGSNPEVDRNRFPTSIALLLLYRNGVPMNFNIDYV